VLSRTGEYALRAVVSLSGHPDAWPISSRRIAEEAGIPPRYLSCILRTLVREGVLTSTPGAGGGFALARPATEITLQNVLEPFESMPGERAGRGDASMASPSDPYAGNARWQRFRRAYSEFLRETTIDEVRRKQRVGGKAAHRKQR